MKTRKAFLSKVLWSHTSGSVTNTHTKEITNTNANKIVNEKIPRKFLTSIDLCVVNQANKYLFLISSYWVESVEISCYMFEIVLSFSKTWYVCR